MKTGLRGNAAIVGIAEYPHQRHYTGPPMFMLEQWADLTFAALVDAGLQARDINGLVCYEISESDSFVPATIVEYLGHPVNFAERLDLGGASAVGMVWRAAAAIELGICDVVICALPFLPVPAWETSNVKDSQLLFRSTSTQWGSPQAEFEIPYGNVGQNQGYALIAQRYAASYGYDAAAMARIVVHQRRSGALNPNAVFHDQPVSVDDVLASKLVADPLRKLEIVMPVSGGAAVVVASKEIAARCRHRPAWITGFGEHLTVKTPTHAVDMCLTPIGPASRQAFNMAGLRPDQIDAAQIYDCYTITVLLTLEDAGFCAKGDGMRFVREHDLSFAGDFPMNTHGGQLAMGQADAAGGMTQVVEAARQIMGRAGARQLARCDSVFVSGTGGVMSEQSALLLQGS